MSDFATRSFWLGATPYEPNPPLEGEAGVDVAIIGGGFTGLWSAYFLKQAEPSLNIAVLEQEVVGYGASGRNGGFVMTLLHRSLKDWVRHAGTEAALLGHKAIARSVNGIGEFCRVHQVQCDYEKNGLLVVATSERQRRWEEADVEAAQALGIEDVRFLEGDALREMVHSPTYLCGLMEDTSALVNPARLAWGIKRVIEGLGVKVYEQTPVTEIREREGKVHITTKGGPSYTGRVRADKAILAANAYVAKFPRLRRYLIPLYTYILLTEPLTPEQHQAIGWARRQGIEDKLNYVHYYRLTRENRILWGGRDAPYYFGSGIGSRHDANPGVFRLLEKTLVQTFPQLAGIRFSHRWGGPVAVTRHFVPTFGTLEGGRVHYGFGYAGHGVAPSHTGGQILRDLVLGRKSDFTALPLVGRKPLPYPPEPLRYIAVKLAHDYWQAQDGGKSVRRSRLVRWARKMS